MHYIFDGELYSGRNHTFSLEDRAFQYGDGVFETIKYSFKRLNFWEDHYFRLMANMRILRMEIPMHFSPEYLEEEMRRLIGAQGWEEQTARIKLIVWRQPGGKYTPDSNDVHFMIVAERLSTSNYQLNDEGLRIDLFKDYFKSEGLLATVKSTSAILYTVASVFRKENGLDECILLNPKKEVVEAISANLFMVKDSTLYTPPLETGCLKGIMRKQVLDLAPQLNLEVKEERFSPFALQKADEVFLTNTIKGIQWVKSYRKKEYSSEWSEKLLKRLNVHVALNSGSGPAVN